MSTNLEYRERERKRKRESRQQASKAQQEKEWEIKDKGDIFLLEYCSGGGKIRNASGYQGVWKWAAVKKNEQEHVRHFLHEWVTRKFLEVSHCSRAKQWQRNEQKSVLHVQSCFFANYTYCCFFTFLVALHDFIFSFIESFIFSPG